MGKMQNSMSHNNRTAPYPSFTEIPSSGQTVQEFSPQNYERASTAWTSEDDLRLMQFRTQGLHWGPIAANFLGKTSNACRKRHERLMEKKNAESWDDGLRIEDLSKAYLEVREQMWKILADALGEKWTTVESKCMEKGLKTLTTAGRAARRHDLAKQHTPPVSRPTSEFDDSGLGIPIDHSPEGSINAAGGMMANSHLTAFHYSNTLASQRHPSISSNGSVSNSGNMQNVPISMVNTMSMPAYNYTQAQPLYTTNGPASPSYMATGYMSPNHYPATAYTTQSNLPSLNRTYDANLIPRNSPHQTALPPPATLLATTTSRTHRDSITATY